MPGTNARGHKVPLGTETSVTRATIFEEFAESIRDVVGVANTTARAALVSALNAAGEGPTTARPLVVHRADAPGAHRIEYTVDGTVWMTASGVLRFATTTAMNNFGTASGAYLSVGDIAFVGAVRYRWDGTVFRPRIAGRVVRSASTFNIAATYTDLSATANWTAEIADGINAYANGWTVPLTGRYLVSYDIRSSGLILAGVTKNYSGASPTLLGAQTAQPVQSVAAASTAFPIALAAGDVLRLYGLSNSGTVPLNVGDGFFGVDWLGD